MNALRQFSLMKGWIAITSLVLMASLAQSIMAQDELPGADSETPAAVDEETTAEDEPLQPAEDGAGDEAPALPEPTQPPTVEAILASETPAPPAAVEMLPTEAMSAPEVEQTAEAPAPTEPDASAAPETTDAPENAALEPAASPDAPVVEETAESEPAAPDVTAITEVTETPAAPETEAAPVSIEATAETVELIEATETVMAETEAAVPFSLVSLFGRVESPLALEQASVVIIGDALQQMIEIGSDGSFSAEVPSGAYRLLITAPHHAPYVLEVVVGEEPLELPAITLTAGDVDSDGVVDMADATMIVENYGQDTLTSPVSADLNEDGMINLFDLAIVGANMQ